ncbi:MAG: hypothetical protein PUP46_03170 [Endozoicomonas sp. (ex Botrylloides leachii)]|nr:hypothetical protein [Endozoicomonas sp. (ex Botrylloides leachii)]
MTCHLRIALLGIVFGSIDEAPVFDDRNKKTDHAPVAELYQQFFV